MTALPRFLHHLIRALLRFAVLALVLCQAQTCFADAAQAQAAPAGLTIILTSMPATTPKAATIYVAGSFNGWLPGDARYRLSVQKSGKYTLTLPANIRGPIEFKFNLGSWDSSEMQTSGAETGNHKFEIPASGAATYSATVPAWRFAPQNLAELKASLEKILIETHTPGMSVAIVRKGGVEWAAGLGLADVASKRAASADTLFRIGSTSKTLTALAILKLVDAGKLSLQDPVRKWVPEVWFENRWEQTDPVRVVDLLEHTTGWDDLPDKAYGEFAPRLALRDALAFSSQSRVSRWRPGTRIAYCNSGPAVAALIIEKITGQPFEEVVQHNLFDPIGMRTATYFQPKAEQAATLYYVDGASVVPYLNKLFRPSGAINASANDMANYLAFFLHRGQANGVDVLPPDALDRMETPTRNWAARQGLRSGYGLYNETSIQNGVVYHGHAGSVVGGLTDFAYNADHSVGYFYSINSWNGPAFARIGRALRAYIARDTVRPALPAVAPLPDNTQAYLGWYEPASPRQANTRFLNRLLGLTYFGITDGKFTASVIGNEEGLSFVPVGGPLFRLATDPIATVALIDQNSEGAFIVVGDQTWKRVPGWLVAVELGFVVWFGLAMLMTLLYAPVWLTANCFKRSQRPSELWIKFWPLLAALSLIASQLPPMLAGEQALMRLGSLTVYSAGVWLATMLFAIASCCTIPALWMAHRRQVRRVVLAYSAFVAAGLLLGFAYLAYWGFIGFRSWA